MLLLVTLQTLLKVTLLHGCFSCFLNCTNGTKSRNASHIKVGVPIFLLVDLIESFSTQWRKTWTARHSKSWINEIQNWWVNLYVHICFKYLSLLTLWSLTPVCLIFLWHNTPSALFHFHTTFQYCFNAYYQMKNYFNNS